MSIPSANYQECQLLYSLSFSFFFSSWFASIVSFVGIGNIIFIWAMRHLEEKTVTIGYVVVGLTLCTVAGRSYWLGQYHQLPDCPKWECECQNSWIQGHCYLQQHTLTTLIYNTYSCLWRRLETLETTKFAIFPVLHLRPSRLLTTWGPWKYHSME